MAGRAQKYQKWSAKARAEDAGTAVSEPGTKTSAGTAGPRARTGPNQPRHGRAAATQRRSGRVRPRAEGAGTAVSEHVTKTSREATRPNQPRAAATQTPPPHPPKRPSLVAGNGGGAGSEMEGKGGHANTQAQWQGAPKSTKNGAKRRARRVPERQFRNPLRRLAGAQERQGQTSPGTHAKAPPPPPARRLAAAQERQGQTSPGTAGPRPRKGDPPARRPPRLPKRPGATAGRAQKYQTWSEKTRRVPERQFKTSSDRAKPAQARPGRGHAKAPPAPPETPKRSGRARPKVPKTERKGARGGCRNGSFGTRYED